MPKIFKTCSLIIPYRTFTKKAVYFSGQLPQLLGNLYLKIFREESEVYLDICETSIMKLFCKNSYSE